MDIPLQEIKDKAFEIGWDDVGVTSAKIPREDIEEYYQWIQEAFHADLDYMKNEIRCYPERLFPGARSAIIFLSNYKKEQDTFRAGSGLVASYARGRDYHHIHRKRLKKFITWLEQRSGKKEIAKGFSDSTPVLEKALAVQAGLGWFGKNSLLIHRKFGTFTLISGIFTSLEIPSTSVKNLRLPKCGSCTRCLDACPTQALVAPYKLDAGKCLSYHLIESKKAIPLEIQQKNPGYIFGCDICQDACPHNVRNPFATSPDFQVSENDIGSYLNFEKIQQYKKNPELLFGTPLKRRGAEGLEHSLSLLN